MLKVRYKGQRGEGVYDLVWNGLVDNVERRYKETFSDTAKAEYEQFMRITPYTSCKGQRLKPSSLAVTVADKNIYEMTSMSVKELVKFLADIELTEQQHPRDQDTKKKSVRGLAFCSRSALIISPLPVARQAFQEGKPSESGLPRRLAQDL